MRVVTCPSCSNRYTMPGHLMGPGGARVVCPTCWLSFIVTSTGEATAPRVVPAPPPPERETRPVAPPEPPTSRSAAFDRLHAIESGPGALCGAALRGRLFSEFGTLVVAAFEDWRVAEGREAPPAEFRQALEAVTGVALSPREEAAALDGGR